MILPQPAKRRFRKLWCQRLGGSPRRQPRFRADLVPILFAHVLIDFDRQSARGVQTVASIFSWARDPVWLVASVLRVVRLKTIYSVELAATVIDPRAGFRKSRAPDSGWALQAFSLRFDVHDSGAHDG